MLPNTTRTRDRRNHERRGATEATPETLVRDAHRLLEHCGIARSHSWVSRQVRSYLHRVAGKGVPFGAFLLNMVQANAAQRAAVAQRGDLRYLLEYSDPTGETAVRNVMTGRSRGPGAAGRRATVAAIGGGSDDAA